MYGSYNLKFDGCCNQGEAHTVIATVIEDVLPGQALEFEIVCMPKSGWSCASSGIGVEATKDEHVTNNTAKEIL